MLAIQSLIHRGAKATSKNWAWLKHYCAFSNECLPLETAREVLNVYSPDPKTSCYVSGGDKAAVNYDCTIIIPVYNTERYLEKCLMSVKQQKTNYAIQVIIINDGSTDRSKEQLSTLDSKVDWKIIHQSNCGLSAARNVGLDLAQGRYLMFLDSDDQISLDAVEKLVSAAYQNDADLVVGGLRSVLDDGKTVIDEKLYSFEKIEPLGKVPGFACGKLYSRKLFAHLRFPVGYWFEDSIMAQIVWPMVKCAYTIPDVVYYYTYNPNSLVNQAERYPKAMDSLYITELLLKEKGKFGLQSTVEDLEQFLHMVRLTYSRTCICSIEVAKSVFAVQCNLYKHFAGLRSTKKTDIGLEEALVNQNYKKYICSVWGRLLLC